MALAASRSTTRIEDEAFCLLGIFDVNMSLIYGEGQNAFRRLQEQILQRSSDLTILAHSSRELFATSARSFVDFGHVKRALHGIQEEFILTNKGLKLMGPVELYHELLKSKCRYDLDASRLVIKLGMRLGDLFVGLCLRQVGPRLFYKDRICKCTHTAVSSVSSLGQVRLQNICVLTSSSDLRLDRSIRDMEHNSLYLARDDNLRLLQVVPQSMWNFEGDYCMRYSDWHLDFDQEMVWAMRFALNRKPDTEIIVLGIDGDPHNVHTIENPGRRSPLVRRLFSNRTTKDSTSVRELESVMQRSLDSPDTLHITTEAGDVRIQASITCRPKACELQRYVSLDTRWLGTGRPQ